MRYYWFEKGESYGIASPDVEGYTPDIEKIEGTMEDKDLSFTVTYTKIADTEDFVDKVKETIADCAK